MERQMDWVTTGHKREAGTKWTAPIMLRLLEGNKSQWKTHLKAPLLSSLIPAGGLASTKPLAKRVREGAIKCWPEYWCKMCPEKKQLSVSIAYAAEVAFNGTQYRAVLNYYYYYLDPHQSTQKDWEVVGGLVARADRRGGTQKGQGTSREGYKSWWKCLPPAIASTLNTHPPHVLHTLDSQLVSKLWGVWGPLGAMRWMKEETQALDSAWCAVSIETLHYNKRQRKGKYRRGRAEDKDGERGGR